MANANEIFTRIQLKYDTLDNWLDLTVPGQGGNLILGEGEVGFCAIPSGDATATTAPTVLFKVGDGKLPFHHSDPTKCLKWASALAADVFAWAKTNGLHIGTPTVTSTTVTDEDGNQTTYTGNAITEVEWDATLNDGKGGIKVTKGTQFATKAELDAALAAFGGDLSSITDNDHRYSFEIVDGKLVVKATNYINGNPGATSTVATLDFLTAAELDTALAGKYDAAGSAAQALTDAKAYVDEQDKFQHDESLLADKLGLKSGTNLKGWTTHQILQNLLFPYTKPAISTTSRSAAAATLENGASQTLSSCSITVAKKSNPITSIKLHNGSTLLQEKTGESLSGTYVFDEFQAITVTKTNNPNLKFTVTDGTDSTTANVGASTFIYPYYWGKCAADATINEALVEGLSKNVVTKSTTKSVTYTCANERMVFAYPCDSKISTANYGGLKSILDPNGFELIDGFTRHDISITGLDGTAVTYYVYVGAPGTCEQFLVTFKY